MQFGCLRYLLNKLQKVQNNAAHHVLRVPETDHFPPHLASLHWLPIGSWIQFKFASLCYSYLSLTAPGYLAELFKVYTPTHQLPCSSDIFTLIFQSISEISPLQAIQLAVCVCVWVGVCVGERVWVYLDYVLILLFFVRH